jgi:hypothetical protein
MRHYVSAQVTSSYRVDTLGRDYSAVVAPKYSSQVLATSSACSRLPSTYAGPERAPQGPPSAPLEHPGSAAGTRTQVEQQTPQQQVRNTIGQEAPQLQVQNTAYDSHFALFRDLGICLANVLAANADNSLPKDVDNVPMCCSYHIYGKRYNRCNRAQDNMLQAPDDADRLFAWCVRASLVLMPPGARKWAGGRPRVVYLSSRHGVKCRGYPRLSSRRPSPKKGQNRLL